MAHQHSDHDHVSYCVGRLVKLYHSQCPWDYVGPCFLYPCYWPDPPAAGLDYGLFAGVHLYFSTLIALLFARRREQHLEAKLREIAAHYHTMHPTKTQDHPAAMRIANMIDHQVQESIAHCMTIIICVSQMPFIRPPIVYNISTALAVIQQGEQITAQIVQALKEHYMGPQSALLSLQSCVTTIVEAYHRRHAPSASRSGAGERL